MEQTLRQMAGQIMIQALAAVQPDAAMRSALEQAELSGRVYLVAIGKAAWQMANAAYQTLGARDHGRCRDHEAWTFARCNRQPCHF